MAYVVGGESSDGVTSTTTKWLRNETVVSERRSVTCDPESLTDGELIRATPDPAASTV